MIVRLLLLLLCSGQAMANQLLDPTRPAWNETTTDANNTAKTKETPAIALTGILYSKDRKLVMLNNRYYRVGERIGQQRITRIEADRIWLSRDDLSGQNAGNIVMMLPHVSTIEKSKKAAAHE